MIELVVLFFAFSSVQGALQPYLNCTRYLEPCVIRQGDCCGYPFYDCLSDGREFLCQNIQDFPELMAELLLRVRGAKDKGDPDINRIDQYVYGLLRQTRGRSATTRRATTRRPTTKRATTRRATTRRATTRRATTRRATTRRATTRRATTRRRDDDDE